MRKKDNGPTRMLKIDIFCKKGVEGDGIYSKTCGAIKRWRDVARRSMAAYVAVELASTDIKLNEEGFLTFSAEKNNIEELEKIVDCVFRGKLANSLENYIRQLAPEWRSDTVQECRRLVLSRLSAKLFNPDNPQSKKKFRTAIKLGERIPCYFMNASLPIKWCPTAQNNIKFSDHTISLRWGDDYIEYKIGTLDPASWRIYNMIASGKLLPGGAWINLNDEGKLQLRLGYHVEYKDLGKELNQKRVLEVAFNEGDDIKFITCGLVCGHKAHFDDKLHYEVNCHAAVAWIDRIKAQADSYSDEKKACGSGYSRSGKSGFRKAWKSSQDRVSRLTKLRSNGCQTWNHKWAQDVFETALRWNCGKVVVVDLPKKVKDDPNSGGICGRPWRWSDFISKLKYRCEEYGIKFVDENRNCEEVVAKLAEGAGGEAANEG